MKEKKLILSLVVIILLAVVLLMTKVGYASVLCNSNETRHFWPDRPDFKVAFVKNSAVITKGRGSIRITGDTTAVLNAEGLRSVGDSVIAEITIKNSSYDLSAELYKTTTNSNKKYFKVTSTLSRNIIAKRSGTALLRIKVELIKTPIERVQKANICVKVVANPTY